jgi:thymidylate kinase
LCGDTGKKMKVLAFSGAQNSGKTTLMKAYAKELEDKGFKVQVGYKLPEGSEGSISRRSKKLGFGINEDSAFESQYHIMLSYLLADIETRKQAELNGADWVIYDRSIMDHLPYTHRVANGEQYYMLEDISNQHRQMFPVDHTVYCYPVPFEDDGERSINQEFQDEIVELFDSIMPTPDVRLPNVPMEQRIDLLHRYLEL